MKTTDGAPLRFFNPGLYQSDEDVISQFCVRESELGFILDILGRNIESPSCRHVLVAAPHGMGKSMLLARTAAELRGNAALSARLLPARFMDECHDIADFAGFCLETMSLLAGELAASDAELAEELRTAVDRMSAEGAEASLRNEAFDMLCQTADRTGKRLVLLVEELEEICLGAGEEFSRRLGEVLLSEPRIMLVATATGGLEPSGEDRQTLAGMFALQTLKPLTAGECRALWRSLDGAGADRDIRPLEILTEGNPRLLAMFAAASRRGQPWSLLEEAAALVDWNTDYFRERLAALPKSERRVFAATLDLWQASTTGEIAARARMDVRAVSTMLRRLIDRGAVAHETPAGGGRKRYAAAEPLHCIWRRLLRGGAAAKEVSRLLRFMEEFYGAGEAQGMRFSSETWETGLAYMEAERAPREVLAVAEDIRQRQGGKAAL
ncbi:MAG: ATP-binding protein [bacterium]|nr:ATP-binding protein [bacterium]